MLLVLRFDGLETERGMASLSSGAAASAVAPVQSSSSEGVAAAAFNMRLFDTTCDDPLSCISSMVFSYSKEESADDGNETLLAMLAVGTFKGRVGLVWMRIVGKKAENARMCWLGTKSREAIRSVRILSRDADDESGELAERKIVGTHPEIHALVGDVSIKRWHLHNILGGQKSKLESKLLQQKMNQGDASNASADMQRYRVVVPCGVEPGSTFKVNVRGAVMEMSCPEDSGPGETVEILLPKSNDALLFEEKRYGRVHSYATCPVSYALQAKCKVLLLVCGQQNAFALALRKKQNSFEWSEQKRLDFGMPRNCIPTYFDGENLVWIQTKRTGDRLVTVWKWNDGDDAKQFRQFQYAKRRGASPWGFELARDCNASLFLVSVHKLNRLRVTSVETGQVVREWKAAERGDDIVAMRVNNVDGDAIAVASRRGVLTVWRLNGVIVSRASVGGKGNRRSCFANFPIFVRSTVVDDRRIFVHNDDSGLDLVVL